jgi:AcrR family transcriptional regulator
MDRTRDDAPASAEDDVREQSAAGEAASLRLRKKRQTRQAIHEAALRLVAENGVAQTSVDAICSEAGVSNRTFFNYFPSKFTAILGLPVVEIHEEQREQFLAAGRDGGDLVHDLCRLMGDVAAAGAERGADRPAFRGVLARRPELVPDLYLLVAELRQQIVQLAEERTDGHRARLAAALVMSAFVCSLDQPLEHGEGDLGEWLYATVQEMAALTR